MSLTPAATDAAFAVDGVVKHFGDVKAIDGVNLQIRAGERVALVGPSGAGKTTLLYLLAGIVAPDCGRISVYGHGRQALVRNGRLRAELVGVMHQQFDLVPNLAVVHNVLAGRLARWGTIRSLVSLVSPRDSAAARAALERVGIGDKIRERTSHLSGGQQQRVALARLVVQDPRAILADEPVSALDPARAEDMIRLLVGLAEEGGRTLIASLHVVPLALQYFDRIIALRDGVVHFDCPSSEVRPEDLDRLYALGAEGGLEREGVAAEASLAAQSSPLPLERLDASAHSRPPEAN